ncbi:MAG: hypothetical protein QM756_44050, partial [Polyangiaceae bacterium]
MDLRRRLGFLQGPGAPRPLAGAQTQREALSEAPPEPAARESLLDDLRSKISEILGRPSEPRKLAEPSETSLPFERVERPEGVLYQRLERLAPSYHVGKMPV